MGFEGEAASRSRLIAFPQEKTMSETALRELLVHGMKDMHFAENAILKALPKMIEAALDEELKDALTNHMEETAGHVERLEEGFQALKEKAEGTPCKAMQGILSEGEEILGKFGKTDAGDAAIIFACQAVEHYEISRYGSMREWADELGLEDVAALLNETLDEEYAADDRLTAIATGGANEDAMEDEDDEDEDDDEAEAGAEETGAKEAPSRKKTST